MPTSTPDGAIVVALFRSEFGEAQPPFHLDCGVDAWGSVAGEYAEVRISLIGDVSGENFDGKMTGTGMDTTFVRIVDGEAYGHLPNENWFHLPEFDQTQPLNPFGALDAGDLSYLGLTTRSGRQLHRLQTHKWLGDDLAAAGMSNMELVSNVFDFYVDDSGIPVEAELVAEVTADFLTSGDTDLTYDVVYKFSDVGEPVTIEAPI